MTECSAAPHEVDRRDSAGAGGDQRRRRAGGHGRRDGSVPLPFGQASKGDAILVALRPKDSQNSGQMYGGKGHSNQVPIGTTGLWRFWSQL